MLDIPETFADEEDLCILTGLVGVGVSNPHEKIT
jgi:hypothetical protein